MSKRVSYEQRQRLFAFMQGHEDLARGRVSGPDAVRVRKLLLEEMADELNAVGSGATKTPEKWLKCWQDWKCDTKAKYTKLKKVRAGTGGGPSPAPLSPLEENLLQFFGLEMVEGVSGVADPLEVSEAVLPTSPSYELEVVEEEQTIFTEAVPVPKPTKQKSNSDPLHSILERQAAAIEDVAAGMHAIASALKQIATALQPAPL